MAEVEYLGTAPDAPPATSAAPRPFLRRTYMWGQDLSGSLQGAGGVGGLLAITRHEHGAAPSKDYWVTSDLNGNVIGLIAENGLRALYEYNPFGKPLRVSEPEEDLNPFRFSSKYTDAESGLCYYGYRYYDAVRGRWITQDPIREKGGVNLYGMVRNGVLHKIDKLGLSAFEPCTVSMFVGHDKETDVWLQEWENGWAAATGHSPGIQWMGTSKGKELYARGSALGCDRSGVNKVKGMNIEDFVSAQSIPAHKAPEFREVEKLASDLEFTELHLVGMIDDVNGTLNVPAFNGGLNPDPIIYNDDDGEPYFSYDMRNQALGYLRLIRVNWEAAMRQANKLAKQAASEKAKCCSKITAKISMTGEADLLFKNALSRMTTDDLISIVGKKDLLLENLAPRQNASNLPARSEHVVEFEIR